MKPLDWILLVLAVPFVLLHVAQFIFMFANIHKIRKITITPGFFIPYIMIMIVVYRIWG